MNDPYNKIHDFTEDIEQMTREIIKYYNLEKYYEEEKAEKEFIAKSEFITEKEMLI